MWYLRDTLSDGVVAGDHDCAGTAGTLTANKLGAGEVGVEAEVGEEGDGGVGVPDLDGPPVDVNEELVGPALCECLDFCHFLLLLLFLYLIQKKWGCDR